jgi:ribosomal protein S19
MSRSIWKGNYVSKFLFRNSLNEKKNIKVWDRASCVPYNLINKNVLIYNGKEFKKIFITRQKIGYKFGEFCFTRTPRKRIEKKVKNISKKK